MTNRWQLYHIHRLSQKQNLDLDNYKELKHQHALVSENLDRLEDELQVTFARRYTILNDFFSFYSQKKLPVSNKKKSMKMTRSSIFNNCIAELRVEWCQHYLKVNSKSAQRFCATIIYLDQNYTVHLILFIEQLFNETCLISSLFFEALQL